MIYVRIDPKSKLPKFQQAVEQIKQLVESGALKPGDRLPSTRNLSESLGVNRSTLYRAYQELWAQGYLESRSGAYTTVRYRGRESGVKVDDSRALIDWGDRTSGSVKSVVQQKMRSTGVAEAVDLIDFTRLSPDPRMYPVEEFRHCQNRVMKQTGASLLDYGDPMGYLPLRETILGHMRLHAMELSLDEILITNGVQQALTLIFQLLIKPGASVLVEEPTYSSMLPLLGLYGAQVKGIPMTDSGMDATRLKQEISKQPPALVYVMPNFQNPTGITTSHSNREQILTICEEEEVPLVEDGFEEELKYFGKAILPIKSLDSKKIVLYLGTISKVLFPGLRIGWIAADAECIKRLAALKYVNDTSGNIMEQAALNLFFRSGAYEIQIKRMHREYRKRMKVALSEARLQIPEGMFTCSKPAGGYTLWVTMKKPLLPEEELLERIEKGGVRVMPGQPFFTQPAQNPCFRISIAHRNENEIREGFQLLGNVLKRL